jgi:hypothetical protein
VKSIAEGRDPSQSGKLIGGADYFDSVATIFDQASADPSASLGDVYRRTATFYRDDVRAQPGESRVTTFIHLKDAYAYAPARNRCLSASGVGGSAT